MAAPGRYELAADSDLWQLVGQGNAEAFETVVRRHQALVSAVAYNACGDLALSEDVAQETFWAAWRERAVLEQATRLRPWLCGIARNLGRNARRRAARPVESAAGLSAGAEPPSPAPGPLDETLSREEEALLWRELAKLPESLREPLILFYREDQSVAGIAAALELSEDAVKQRLSRGRALLRERVAELIEGALRRSRPGRTFTVAVMTGLTAHAAAPATASAAVTGVATSAKAAAAGAGIAAGWLGGLLGSGIGLGGAWLGVWLPAQLAPTKRERAAIWRIGKRTLIVSLAFVAGLYGLVLGFAGGRSYLLVLGAWQAAYMAYVTGESVILACALKRIRAELGPAAEANDSPLRARLNAPARRYRGRVYRSRATLLGVPLVHINVADPPDALGFGAPGPRVAQRRVARGWIAIGDDARGIVLAIGSSARGFVAVGGRALGVVSVGGIAAGVVAVGGIGLGAFALGGLAVGGWAAGAGAIAWESAFGAFAVARHAAVGVGAVAFDYALGIDGRATHFNDEAARALVLGHPLRRAVEWVLAHWAPCLAGGLAFELLLAGVVLSLMYRRDRGCSEAETNP